MDFYKDDPCEFFAQKEIASGNVNEKDSALTSKIHKAISIIQFKLEGEIIKRRFLNEMQDRLVLEKINFTKGTINLNGKEYPLRDNHFPTIDQSNPYALSIEEAEIVGKLRFSFLNSQRLQKHIQFLYSKGSMYKVYNSNLLYHGCIPLTKDGTFKKIEIEGQEFEGKAYIDRLESIAIDAYFNKTNPEAKITGLDYMWYLWTGPSSPLYGKDKMATFERYFIEDKEPHAEKKNPYYEYRDNEELCGKILEEFRLDPRKSRIINGHVPVIHKKGESPIKAKGKLLVIDGGLSKAYQHQTGIAGYTLIYNSYGLLLVSHEPFESTRNAIENENDIVSFTTIVEVSSGRKRVADTDVGESIKKEIQELQMLLQAYRLGLIK
jgi:fructose-1,6-bisphosphatase III